jgi:hypothetical protein
MDAPYINFRSYQALLWLRSKALLRTSQAFNFGRVYTTHAPIASLYRLPWMHQNGLAFGATQYGLRTLSKIG